MTITSEIKFSVVKPYPDIRMGARLFALSRDKVDVYPSVSGRRNFVVNKSTGEHIDRYKYFDNLTSANGTYNKSVMITFSVQCASLFYEFVSKMKLGNVIPCSSENEMSEEYKNVLCDEKSKKYVLSKVFYWSVSLHDLLNFLQCLDNNCHPLFLSWFPHISLAIDKVVEKQTNCSDVFSNIYKQSKLLNTGRFLEKNFVMKHCHGTPCNELHENNVRGVVLGMIEEWKNIESYIRQYGVVPNSLFENLMSFNYEDVYSLSEKCFCDCKPLFKNHLTFKSIGDILTAVPCQKDYCQCPFAGILINKMIEGDSDLCPILFGDKELIKDDANSDELLDIVDSNNNPYYSLYKGRIFNNDNAN